MNKSKNETCEGFQQNNHLAVSHAHLDDIYLDKFWSLLGHGADGLFCSIN